MKKIIVGNWKMHGFVTMAHPLVTSVLAQARQSSEYVEVVICPPATLIVRIAEWLTGTVVKLGAQNCHDQDHGAFTGEISAPMLMDAECSYVIVGHSERRQFNGETNAIIAKKAASAIKAGLIPIICVGESAEERAKGQAEAIVAAQIQECLPEGARLGNFMLAYEPVWAIGSGKTPSNIDIRQMHAHIISVISGRVGLAAKDVHILYGGSVKADNAKEIMQIEGVAGVLVGGASLKAEEFCRIIAAA